MIIKKIIFSSLALFLASSANCQDPDAWEERHNRMQPPDKVMDAIGVKTGMVVGEVGAGRGRYVVHMAERVGHSGKVYANDIDRNALKYLEHRCERDNISNVITVPGDVTDPKLPEGKLDLIYIINTYHHLDDKTGLMRNIRPALKPGGKFVIIENEPAKSGWNSHTTPEKVVIEEAAESGFELIRIESFLKEDNIYIFRIKEPGMDL
jgi:ubiquinone/menaquinone biosynthesis C-methylase UbiE